MSSNPVGNPPIREEYGSPGYQKFLAAISNKLNKLSQTTITDSTTSSVSVTSSDATSVTSPDASTVTGTATTGGDGFLDATQFNNAITAINSIGTLANEMKGDYNSAVTLINELKTDLNTLKNDLNTAISDMNTLNEALRDAGIIK